MFHRCTKLETIPTESININNTDKVLPEDADPVTTARYVFCVANLLSFSDMASIIHKCEKVTDFSYCCSAVTINSS